MCWEQKEEDKVNTITKTYKKEEKGEKVETAEDDEQERKREE